MAKSLLMPVFVVMRDCVITINPGFVNPGDFKLVVRSFDNFDPSNFADPYLSVAHLAAPGQYLFTECLKGNPFTLLEKHTDWIKHLPQKRKVFDDGKALMSKVNEAIYTKEERLEIYKCLYTPKSLYLSNGNAVEIERKNGTVRLHSVMNISPTETDDHRVLWQTPGFSQETTLAEAGNRAIEITGEPFGQTTTIVYSEWIKQKPQGAMNLPTFPSLLSKKEEK